MRSDSFSSLGIIQTTGNQSHPELRTEIEDLEQTIKLNKLILEDLLSSLSISKSSKEVSYDTEIPLMTSAKIYQILKAENDLLESSERRIKTEIKQGEIAILQAKEQAKRCKIRKKDSIEKLNEEKTQIRKELEIKEETIQKLENYCQDIETDIEEVNRDINDDPNRLIKETYKLIKAVESSLYDAKIEREQEAEKCYELEEEILRLKTSIIASTPKVGKTVKDIIQDYN